MRKKKKKYEVEHFQSTKETVNYGTNLSSAKRDFEQSIKII